MREAEKNDAGDRQNAERSAALSDARRLTPDALFVLAATALGAWLRLRELAVPSFWFDEIFHYKAASQAVAQPLWRWLTIFEIENGPLFYALQLVGRISHSPEFSARIAPALCGIATIPVVWLAARAMNVDRSIPYAATILIAISPLDVYYSREARPYAMVVLLAAALVLAVLGDAFGIFITLLIVAFYTGAMMAPVIASAIVATLKKPRWWITAVACATLLTIFYRPGRYPQQMTVPGLTTADLRGVFESFSVVAVDASRPHRGAYAFAALAIAGAIVLFRRGRMAVIAIGILPVAIGVIATWLLHRPFGVRYVIGGLPGYLLLVAAGIAAISSLAQRFAVPAAIVIAAILAREGWNAALEEPFQKLDWRAIARSIAEHAHEKDAIIAGDVWTFEQLRFYLPPRFRLFDAGGTREGGEIQAYQNTTSWLVVADASTEFAQWACRFPVLLASPLQQFRLHYCPNNYYFLTDRSTSPEQRALRASFSGLSFGPGDDALLGDGWAGPERDGDGYARWVLGRRAFIALPAAGPMSIDVLGVPNQAMTVNLNNTPIARLALRPQRTTYTINGAFRDDINILRFDFDRTVAPSEVDPGSSDHRPLAARFYGIRFSSHLVRLDEGDTYIDENSVWRSRGGRELPPNIDRAKLAQLLGSLGLDPNRAIAALASKRVMLANLAATIADDSACIDDSQFLRTLWRSLLSREITDRELAQFSGELHRGVRRSDMAWRLGNSDEVRARFR